MAVRPGGCSGFSYEMFFDTDVAADDRPHRRRPASRSWSTRPAPSSLRAPRSTTRTASRAPGSPSRTPTPSAAAGCGKSVLSRAVLANAGSAAQRGVDLDPCRRWRRAAAAILPSEPTRSRAGLERQERWFYGRGEDGRGSLAGSAKTSRWSGLRRRGGRGGRRAGSWCTGPQAAERQ